jgi:hypothetical protein
VKELSGTELYQYLMNEQEKIQDALDEESEGSSTALRRGAWAMPRELLNALSWDQKGMSFINL